MPTPAEDLVSLLIGGHVHSQWSRYEVDSDLLLAADAWSVDLGLPGGKVPAFVSAGAPVEVRVGTETVMLGSIDDITDAAEKGSLTLAINGRDYAGLLVDCSAPIFSAKQASLAEIVANVVKPLGITRVRIDAAAPRTAEKVSVEPGDTAWDTLVKAAEANGLWPWFEPDGTLVVGGPDYSRPPVATLALRQSGKGNNLLKLSRTRSMSPRHSEITVLGQAHGTAIEDGRHAIQSTVRDRGVNLYRPRIVIDNDVENTSTARAKARKALSDSRLQGLTLTAEVKGHRTSSGVLWQPGQRVHVISEPHEIDATFFLMARKFTGGRQLPTLTIMTLKEDGVWVLDAHPHKRKRGKARTRKGEELEIIDVG